MDPQKRAKQRSSGGGGGRGYAHFLTSSSKALRGEPHHPSSSPSPPPSPSAAAATMSPATAAVGELRRRVRQRLDAALSSLLMQVTVENLAQHEEEEEVDEEEEVGVEVDVTEVAATAADQATASKPLFLRLYDFLLVAGLYMYQTLAFLLAWRPLSAYGASTRRPYVRSLKLQMRSARSYGEWLRAATQLDEEEGLAAWKDEEQTTLYNHALIRARLDHLRRVRADGDRHALMNALRSGLLRNLGGLGNPSLYNYARSGTKRLITEYVDEVIVSLEDLLVGGGGDDDDDDDEALVLAADDAPSDGFALSAAEKLEFFQRTRHAYGRTALMLSGGAALGMYHFGTIKALSDEGLLPRIISGSSVGALVGAKQQKKKGKGVGKGKKSSSSRSASPAAVDGGGDDDAHETGGGDGDDDGGDVPLTLSAAARYYVKGAPEVILSACTQQLDADSNDARPLSDAERAALRELVTTLARDGLRTLAFAYRDEPVGGAFDASLARLVFQGLVGIKDPLRPEVTRAVADCRRAGITVRMVTGDALDTAKQIARECGILRNGGVALLGEDVRALPDAELDRMLIDDDDDEVEEEAASAAAMRRPQLQVIARCSPTDKQRLVRRLRELGRVVASTGDGTNDAPQLKLADVGFAMGIAGTEVAKEACDIILMDDNFSSVVKAVVWGRNVFDSVRKFLQFQLTVNVVALVIAFVSSIYVGFSVLTAVQLLWLNLVMDTFGALALATDRPTSSMLERKPAGRDEPLITRRMWRFIGAHGLFQIIVLLTLLVIFKETGGVGVDNGTVLFSHATVPPEPCLPGATGCICAPPTDDEAAAAAGARAPLGTCRGASGDGERGAGDRCVPFGDDEDNVWCVASDADLAAPAMLGAVGHACAADDACRDPFDFCREGLRGVGHGVCLARFSGKTKPSHGQTVIFNCFIWMAVFNEFNARILDNRLLPVAGLLENRLFWFIIAVIAVVQTLMTLFGGDFTQTVQLDALEWLGCMLLALLVVPFGVFVRALPVVNAEPKRRRVTIADDGSTSAASSPPPLPPAEDSV